MSSPSSPHRLSSQDALFLHSESDTIGMHTMGTLILQPPDENFGYTEVVDAVRQRIHLMPPLRKRLLEIPVALGEPVLVDDPDFDIENHVHRLAVPQPGTLREIAPIIGDIAGRPLSRSQPLWEMWVIEGMSEGRIALAMKLHHSTLDGATGSSMMGGLLDLSPDAVPEKATEEWAPAPLPSSLDLITSSLTERVVNPLWLGGLIVKTARGLLARSRAIQEITPEGEEAPPLFQGGPMTHMNRSISARRAIAYGSAPLDEIKQIKDVYGVTVNDVILAATTLALRRYLQDHDDLPDVPLLSLVPISTKSDDEKQDFDNKVSSLVVDLPTHLEDPEEILRSVHEETANAKRVFSSIEDDLLPEWMKLFYPPLASALFKLYGDLDLPGRLEAPFANVVVSNMMGPPIPLYFGGARVEAVYPMGPVAHGLGVNLTLLSNMGRMDIGVLTCPDSVPNPWEITEGFAQAVADLRLAAEKREGV